MCRMFEMAGPHQSLFRIIIVLVVHLLLAHFCRGQFHLTGPPQPIVATVGDDIILPCHLQPGVDVAGKTLEWTRPDLDPRFVFVWRAGQDLANLKNPSYKGRTSVNTGELKHGNISLKLSNVKPSDGGRYKCYIPDLNTESLVELVVGAASSPSISLSGLDRNKGAVVLQCESTGWYPEPEVFWLDGEGNLLSAGPTETVRGPDDLYTVSSRVTVEKRHSNSFTCRVQQNSTNQIRETLIHVPDDFFEVLSSSSSTTVGLAVSLTVCILVILILGFFVWKFKTKRSHRDETDKGVKMDQSKHHKTEDQVVTEEEPERRQLLTHETVQMRDLNEGQAAGIRPEQEQLSNEEAKKLLKLLEEELETKKTELREKRSDLQQLHEEKQRKEENVERLKEQLENKKTEVETLENEQAKLSWFSSGSKNKDKRKKKMEDGNKVDTRKQQQDTPQTELDSTTKEGSKKKKQLKKKKDEVKKEAENLKKQLETEEKELNTKTKEFDKKQVKVQQLQEEIQKKETNLKTLMEKLESNNKEFKWPLSNRQDSKEEKLKEEQQKLKEELQKLKEEQQRREEAENKVQTLEEELQKKTRELQEEKQKREKAEEEVQRKNQELNEKTDEMMGSKDETIRKETEDKEKGLSKVRMLKNQFKSKIKEIGNKDETIKKERRDEEEAQSKMETLKNQFESKNKEIGNKDETIKKERRDEEEAQSKMETLKNQFESKNKEIGSKDETIKKETQEKEKAQSKVRMLKNPFKSKNTERESEKQNSSPVCQNSTRKPAVVFKFNPQNKYIKLMNTSEQDQQLGGWTLEIQVNKNEPIKHTFEGSFSIKTGEVLTVGYHDYYLSIHCRTDLVLKELMSWSYADTVQVSLISDTGKIEYNSVYNP